MQIHPGASGRFVNGDSSQFAGSVRICRIPIGDTGMTANRVEFAPGARTHWHRHEHGQLLHVTSGEGQVATEGTPARAIHPGDVVWTEPGEWHWHGAAPYSPLSHNALSFGTTTWGHAVAPEPEPEPEAL
jgi:quercetin dioxygenase-like cupin family protein